MKLAIIGPTALALEASLRFHSHGAAVTWFVTDSTHEESDFEDYLGPESYVSSFGLDILGQLNLPYRKEETFQFNYWKTNYFLPLISYLSQEQKIKHHQVISVSKRFLAADEVPSGRSRFLDLFRVTYEVNPQEFIKEQEQQNPETFERLSQELVQSLQTHLEMYEDFDLVLDLRPKNWIRSLSITGYALGEKRVSREHLHYGHEGLNLVKTNLMMEEVRELALIGSTPLAAEILIKLSPWLKDERNRLFVISHEAWPFAQFMEESEEKAKECLKSVISFHEAEFEKEITVFHQKLREWQQLDDFVQAKIPKPVEPIPRLVFFSGHNATAVDQLVDKRRVFLTLEKPDFRDGLKHPENNLLDLKTIGVDRVLVASPFERKPFEVNLLSDEKGFFILTPTHPMIKNSWDSDLKSLKGLENEIFKLFSPTSAH
jgi:hypothetical protein